MRILLTGGSGFIGKNLYESLKNKYRIFAPSHRELDLLNLENTRKYIKNKKINVIIHSAIKGGDNVFNQTIQMFINIYRNADYVNKIIHFGSGAEYAKTRDLKKVKEIEFGKYLPEDPYGLAKYLCHLIGKENKKIINLRLFGIYGKYESPYYKFISNSIVKNLSNLPIIIKQDVIFDYLFIEDLVKIVDKFLKNTPKFDSYNITPTKSISLLEIAKIINNISSKKVNIRVVNKNLNFQYSGSNKRLSNELPKYTFTSYREGINKLFLYYSKNFSKIDKRDIIKDDYFLKSKIRKKNDYERS